MKLFKSRRLMLMLISFALIFAFGVITSVAQEKQIRDFLQKKGAPSAEQEKVKINEVTEPATTTFYVTAKVLPLDEGRLYMAYEAIGATVNDRGEGLFHNATLRALGGMIVEKGIYKDERGWGVYNLQNGDKVFFTYTWAGEVKPGGIGTGKGIVTFTGGTGKCVGIQGSFESTRTMVRTALEGVGQSYTKASIKYKLP